MKSIRVILLSAIIVASLAIKHTAATTSEAADGTAIQLQVYNLHANQYRTETLTKFTKYSGGWQSLRSTRPLRRGTIVQVVIRIAQGDYTNLGVTTDPEGLYSEYVGQDENSWSYFCNNGGKYTRGTNIAYGPKCGAGDTVKIRIDLTEGKGTIQYFLNGNSLGLAWGGLLGLSKDMYFAFGGYASSESWEILSYSSKTPA